MKRSWWYNSGKKFKWTGLGLLFLLILNNCLSFFIHFNLRINLFSGGQEGGQLHFIFGRIFLTEEGEEIWFKLLTILFLAYFPFKLVVQLILDFGRKYAGRVLTVYLTKNLLILSTQKNLVIKNDFFDLISDFSQQLVAFFSNLVSTITTIFLEIFSLCFLVITRDLIDLINLVVGFNFLTLMFLVLFRFYFNSSIKKNEREKKDCQQSEKTQLRNFLASANHSSPSPSLENIFFLLDSNSTQLFLHFFNSVLFRLPNLLIPGLSILFLFFYYHFYPKNHSINWNVYLIALGCQNLLWKFGRMLDLLYSWNAFSESYLQLKDKKLW